MKELKIEYNPETGLAYAKLVHKGKIFEAYSKPVADDFEDRSEYFGCGLALSKATLKALKYEFSLIKQDYLNAVKIENACKQSKSFDAESPTAKALYRQINARKKDYKLFKEYIKSYKLYVDSKDRVRHKILDKWGHKE